MEQIPHNEGAFDSIPKRYQQQYEQLKSFEEIQAVTPPELFDPETNTCALDHFEQFEKEHDLSYEEKIFVRGLVTYIDGPIIDVDFSDGDPDSEVQRREWENKALATESAEAFSLYTSNQLKLRNIRNVLQAIDILPGMSEETRTRAQEIQDIIYGNDTKPDYRHWQERQEKKTLAERVLVLARVAYSEYIATKAGS